MTTIASGHGVTHSRLTPDNDRLQPALRCSHLITNLWEMFLHACLKLTFRELVHLDRSVHSSVLNGSRRSQNMHSLTWWPTVVAVLIATITDLRSRKIPNWLVFPLMISGIAV